MKKNYGSPKAVIHNIPTDDVLRTSLTVLSVGEEENLSVIDIGKAFGN